LCAETVSPSIIDFAQAAILSPWIFIFAEKK